MLEILAPCGGMDSLIAALNSGADAVYLGEKQFSARKNAKNFDDNELEEAVKLCHLSGVKVYIALNILIYDDEITPIIDTLDFIAKLSVDAVIIQDLGVYYLIKKYYPTLPVHASTQMIIHSVDGAKKAKELGFSRVVLARELSFSQIENIIKNVDIETEVFVHGAHCVCISGICYMSAMLGGRSGNRGQCAQPCRLNFKNKDKEYILSLKDLSLIPYLKKLEKIGVTSAKIEGRMKRPEYVAATVIACKNVLSGIEPDMNLLEKVFSRSGFTSGYFDDNYSDMQGIRTDEDIKSTSETLSNLKTLYNKPYKRFKVDFDIELRKGFPAKCVAKCEDFLVFTLGNICENSIKFSITEKDIAEQMGKLGGTVFQAGKITCAIEDGIMLSAKDINELRRKTVEKISDKIFARNTPIYEKNKHTV